ncbi:chlorophyll(ide) b reductase NOL chloroplastic isoform X1 [Tripterygium wilfordii]|uniref:chlorophyll(ide) b reductase n=1 Tax=Tripterygium wilfordii TaxID=458696 RepID=A0A7J7C5H1_TRIWF|nr:chlorophyll(ide) b reductase NOL, chloroplastic [Tripterygium wilfordii]KAF5729374.1 chlorophyll(ide) b reductase NOL chloroplastic isoform X1 [Tripterygium wilfordii]
MAMTATSTTSFPLPFSPQSYTHFFNPRFHPQFGRDFGSRQRPFVLRSSRNSSKNVAIRSYPRVRAAQEPSGKREPMVPPYNVIITGSTKGIGYALAKEFLKAGDNVVICSRTAEHVESTVHSLRGEFGEQHVLGTKCDVRKAQDVKDLVAFAKQNLKYIDIWINNAGSNAYSFKPLTEASDEDLIQVVTTNTLGLMICCREAIKMMMDQPRGGHIFNIDGAGSDGRPTPRFAAYGATKRSVVHLTKSLQAELQMQDVKNVVVHNLSPGMVTTDLLMSGANTKQAKFFINVLAEPAEVVAEYLVPNIRSIPANGSMKATYIRFLTGIKAYSQIFSRLAFGARRNRYVLED